MATRREGVPHLPLHVLLVGFTLFTIYPILWVVSIAFSGRQNLAIAMLPPEPTTMDRLRAITPWPEEWSLSNFTSVMEDVIQDKEVVGAYLGT
jgi:arabinogalactan oligomer/maltooligosaccharide transport system permease protein